MATALIYPLLEFIGTATAEVATEIGLSSTASTAAGTATQGAVASQIGQQIDALAISMLGQDNVNQLNAFKQDVNNYAEEVYAGLGPDGVDVQYFLNKYPYASTATPTATPTVSSSIPKRLIPNIFDGGAVTDKPTVVIKKNLFDGGVATSDSGGGGVDDGKTPPVVPVTPVTPAPISSYLLPNSSIPVKTLDITTIAGYIIQYANTICSQSKIDTVGAITETLKVNPHFISVSKELNGFYSSVIPKTEEYTQLASVYNGRNLTLYNCIGRFDKVSNGMVFTLIDELNDRVELKENKGFVLPSIYGVFVGPYSRNNSNPISLLDLFAAFHDQDYTQNGFFDKTGDYKLISRISQNYDRMIPAEKPAAKIALGWFSTMGVSIGSLIGSLPKNIDTVVTTDLPNDDIYSFVYPTKSTEMPIEQYAAERTQWYSDLSKEFKAQTVSSSVFATVGKNTFLANEFGNILIELL